MRNQWIAILGACAVFGAGAAAAKEACGVKTHMRFGETRAYFQDVLAACVPDGECKMVSEVSSDAFASGYRHQLRMVFADSAAAPALSFIAVEPMADLGKPTSLRLGREQVDLSGKITAQNGVANEYGFTDPAIGAELADRLIYRARSAVWSFAADGTGAATSASFPLRGAARARAWITCMQRPE